ncbi:MAG: cell division protein FtsI (penicillin-binding protein 3) [Oleiphilaceae bacterium]|jgi:cell division protein FtsI (penicillin-binding protein 3)
MEANQKNNNAIYIAWRFWFLLGFLALCALVLFYRAIDLHVFEQAFLSGQGDARTIRFELLDAHRGVITDRHGEPLAISAPVETVYANPKQMTLSPGELKKLAKSLGLSFEWLKRKIERNKAKSFIYLKRKMAPHEVKAVLALNLDGVYSRREYKRYYPAGEVAAHVVGFTSIDEKGQEGIELSYDDWLSGSVGKKRVLKDRKARVIKDFGPVKVAEPGRDIRLSLDMRIQYLAYRELKAAVSTHKAKAGSVVVLDINTGDVLAMVNQPSYNPNNRQNINVSHLRNRAITDVFEPGSTMKVATVSAALESKKYSLSTVLDTSPGFLRLGRKAIRDHRNYGELSVLNIVAKSSNVGISKIALALSGDVVWDMFYRLGFGQGTGIGFPGESIGYLPNSTRWKPLTVATMSYGYGLNATALQLAQAYMILGNGGLKHPLALVYRDEVGTGEQIITKDVSNSLRKVMNAVVSKGGTGTRATVPLYGVGGKTGTVHRVGKSGYEKSEYKALFAGVAPIKKPEIAVVVVIDSPAGAEYYGGEVAAPVFSRVVNGAMRLLNVRPDKDLAETVQSESEQEFSRLLLTRNKG